MRGEGRADELARVRDRDARAPAPARDIALTALVAVPDHARTGLLPGGGHVTIAVLERAPRIVGVRLGPRPELVRLARAALGIALATVLVFVLDREAIPVPVRVCSRLLGRGQGRW